MSDEINDPSLELFAAQLASLAPATPRLDRDRLMYLAGRQAAATASPPRWFWPAATAAMTALAASLAFFLLTAPRSEVVGQTPLAIGPTENDFTPSGAGTQTLPTAADEIADAADAPSAIESVPGSGQHYLKLRQLILTAGVDALPDPSDGIGVNKFSAPFDQRHLLDDFLEG